GLKICFLLMARTYFEAMASAPTNASIKKPFHEFSGPVIRAKMKIVMYVDSEFEGALVILTNAQLVTKQAIKSTASDRARLNGLNGKTPKKDIKKPASHSTTRLWKVSRYMVILFR